MKIVTEIFTWLGENFWLVVIGCAEALAALLLVSKYIISKIKHTGMRSSDITGSGRLAELIDTKADIACIVLRTSDLYCLETDGNAQGLLGTDTGRLRADVSDICRNFAKEDDRRDFILRYIYGSSDDDMSQDFLMKDGRWIGVSRHIIGNSMLIIVTDRSNAHEVLDNYEEQLAKAESESQFKTSFLSRMSHEIRTPMNGIIGMITLAKGKLDADHAAYGYLDRAIEQSDHLLSLINDILDMSRIEAGKVELEENPFSVHGLANKLYDMFAKTVKAKGINYEVRIEELEKDMLIGDELRISQVIINFLSNAVKFTQEGEIIVTIRQMMLHEGRSDIMIRVHDTGIGMNPEFIGRIFKPFEQEDRSTTRRFGGTGLGMAISDQLIKLMNGQIVVESEKGRGSDFSVYLSLKIAEDTAASDTANAVNAGMAGTMPETDKSSAAAAVSGSTSAAAAGQGASGRSGSGLRSGSGDGTGDNGGDSSNEDVFNGRSILLAEDNELNAMIAVEILVGMGAKVELAKNGQEAVDRFAESKPGDYDFILMDVQMPVMDGRQTARTIRAMSRPDAQTILIFALSADAFVEDVRLSVESGMNGHFAKPIDFNHLRTEIAGYLKHDK